MTKPRRQRYYAYDARRGGVLWLDRKTHAFIEERPHTVSHFQCKSFTGRSALMTVEQFKQERKDWQQSLTAPSTRM